MWERLAGGTAAVLTGAHLSPTLFPPGLARPAPRSYCTPGDGGVKGPINTSVVDRHPGDRWLVLLVCSYWVGTQGGANHTTPHWNQASPLLQLNGAVCGILAGSSPSPSSNSIECGRVCCGFPSVGLLAVIRRFVILARRKEI